MNLPIDSVMARVAARTAKVATLEGNGSITAESPESSNSGSFDVDLKKPDSLLATFSGPFGLHVGTLSLARNHFVYFDKLHNNAIAGKPDGTTIRSMFNLNMDFDEIIDAFTGDFPMPAPGDSLIRFAVDEDDDYVALYKRKNEEHEYHIDASTFMIASYRELDSLNKPVVIATSGRYATEGEIPMARLLRVIFPRERRAITVAYDDVKPNVSVRCAFTLPENVEVIHR